MLLNAKMYVRRNASHTITGMFSLCDSDDVTKGAVNMSHVVSDGVFFSPHCADEFISQS